MAPAEWQAHRGKNLPIHVLSVRIVGAQTWVQIRFETGDVCGETLEKVTPLEGWIPAYPEFGWSNGQLHEMHDFVNAMREGRQPECDLELAIDVTLAIYAGYVSAARKGAEVEVPRL